MLIDDLFGEEGERGTGLLKEHPEHDVEGEDDQHCDHHVARHLTDTEAFDQQCDTQQGKQREQNEALQIRSVNGQQEVDHRNRNGETQDDQQQAHRLIALCRRQTDGLELSLTEPEPHQTDQHADARSNKHGLIIRQSLLTEYSACQETGQDRRHKGTGIDAHIENGEGRVAALIALRIQLADHGRDVGLEQTVTRDDGGQAELEHIELRQRDHE